MITLIGALDRNRVIGMKGQLPWHLPADLAHFKASTLHHTIIMGRLTYEAIGRPLPERNNVVLSAQHGDQVWMDAKGVTWCPSLSQLQQACAEDNAWMVIGGGQVYQQLMPYAKRMILTFVDAALEGDAFFPTYDMAHWQTISEHHHPADARHDYAFTITTLERQDLPQALSAL